MTTYPPKTIFRYFPNNSDPDPDPELHYSAVVLKDESLFEVKSPNSLRPKQFYVSISHWLTSLPDSPSIDKIKIGIYTKPIIVNNKKEKKPQILRIRIPSKKSRFTSTIWMHHVLTMMKEANPVLVKNEKVIIAFNNVVECLKKYNDVIQTRLPLPYNKYTHTQGITLQTLNDNYIERYGRYGLFGIPGQLKDAYRNITPENTVIYNEVLNNIHNIYAPLYELIKRDVIPYMERKEHENRNKSMVRACRRRIQHLERKRNNLEKYHQRIIQSIDCEISKFITILTKALEPCEITEFPPLPLE